MPSLPRTRAGIVLASLATVLVACGAPTPSPTSLPVPAATCGGLRILIENALPCDGVVAAALAELRTRAPAHLTRGISAIRVDLASCPRREVPRQVDCRDEAFAQLVTVEFGPATDDRATEPSLTVAVAPVTGRILGVINPLVR